MADIVTKARQSLHQSLLGCLALVLALSTLLAGLFLLLILTSLFWVPVSTPPQLDVPSGLRREAVKLCVGARRGFRRAPLVSSRDPIFFFKTPGTTQLGNNDPGFHLPIFFCNARNSGVHWKLVH